MNKYSILYVSTNLAMDEQINIGLALELPGGTKFEYSRKKLEAVKLLIPKNVYEFIVMQLEVIDKSYSKDSFMNAIKYDPNNNNLLVVSKPKTIDSNNFDVLFKKFIENENN